MPAAVDIVARIAKKYKIGNFKVATHKFAVDQCRGSSQAGKSIVLYDSGREDWPRILQEIEDRFEKSKPPIEPIRDDGGGRIPAFPDRPVKGSNYAYYRNDGSYPGGIYIAADKIRAMNLPEDSRYNPDGVADPFADLKIQNAHFDRPRKQRDNTALLRECFSLRKHSEVVFGVECKYITDIEGLEESLTHANIENRRVYGHVDPATRFFEVDCLNQAFAEEIEPFLTRYLLKGSPREKWMRKENVSCRAALAPPKNSIDELALLRALADEGIKYRRYRSNNLWRNVIEVSSPGHLAKLEKLIDADANRTSDMNRSSQKRERPLRTPYGPG